ncbi:hypothetical protein GWK47_050232 [Chionoecetes opilio]|uniref:Uncharacterized protein n=1 Tax=Chionoecetes opilio TaxID=41210 RepID=A0A8J4Y8I8_CHIOP|nr:hypothetical protein GWK47_050232 [Chionoecetes opilio]
MRHPHKTHVARNRPLLTCRGERRSPREMVLGALSGALVCHGTHAATRDELVRLTLHLRPDTRPHASHVPATVPLHFLTRYDDSWDDDVDKGIIEAVPQAAHQWCPQNGGSAKKGRKAPSHGRLSAPQPCEPQRAHHTRPPFDLVL